MKTINLKIFTTFFEDKQAYSVLIKNRVVLLNIGSLHNRFSVLNDYTTESDMEQFGWWRIS